MTTESEVRTITKIVLDTKDKQILNNAAGLLNCISREMCGMHATEVKVISYQASKEDDYLDVEEIAEFIRTLSEIQNCLSIEIESPYYEGMSE